MIRQLISATKPVRFFASVDAQKRLKPASTEDGYKPFCSVDRPLETEEQRKERLRIRREKYSARRRTKKY